jgi:hypothetical protein
MLEEKMARLRPQGEPVMKRPEFGYHSVIAATADIEKWVEIDLGGMLNYLRSYCMLVTMSLPGSERALDFPCVTGSKRLRPRDVRQVGLQALCRMQRLRALRIPG